MEMTLPERKAPVPNSQTQSLPSIASLTSSLTHADQSPIQSVIQPRQPSCEARDSGTWSSVSQSKHSSGLSGISGSGGLQLQTILNAEDSPSRNSMTVPETPSSSRYSGQLNALPSLNQGFDNRVSFESSTFFDSRRSSVDSRVNVGLGHLAISPSSPYDSQNASRASLSSNLNQQRGIAPSINGSISGSIAGSVAGGSVNGATPLSPLGPRSKPRANLPPRQAPVINPNPRSVSGMPDPMAAAPTKGYAWAFPAELDPDERRPSSSGESSVERSLPSRQGSYATATSMSSIYNDGLPPGQKRFEDGVSTTHHHSMQHRAVTNLQGADAAASSGSGNYSRTPELRVSHKMAERKRRSEMKQLFDELNGILPNSPGSKSSKWEILTKSIEYIKTLGRAHEAARTENARLRPDAEYSRRAQEENDMLRNEVQAMWGRLRQLDPNNPHIYGSMTGMLAQQHSQNPTNGANNVLPPLQPPPQQWLPPPPPSSQMQGVEFGNGRAYESR